LDQTIEIQRYRETFREVKYDKILESNEHSIDIGLLNGRKQDELTKLKISFAKRTGIPTTKATLERKVGKAVIDAIVKLLK
jgi:hypothetical protein